MATASGQLFGWDVVEEDDVLVDVLGNFEADDVDVIAGLLGSVRVDVLVPTSGRDVETTTAPR